MPQSKLYKEYTGTGASGGNAGDGNSITSPRPFSDDSEELENYINKIYMGLKEVIIKKNQLLITQIELK